MSSPTNDFSDAEKEVEALLAPQPNPQEATMMQEFMNAIKYAPFYPLCRSMEQTFDDTQAWQLDIAAHRDTFLQALTGGRADLQPVYDAIFDAMESGDESALLAGFKNLEARWGVLRPYT